MGQLAPQTHPQTAGCVFVFLRLPPPPKIIIIIIRGNGFSFRGFLLLKPPKKRYPENYTLSCQIM